MFANLTCTHIILIIVAILVLIWLVSWLIRRKNKQIVNQLVQNPQVNTPDFATKSSSGSTNNSPSFAIQTENSPFVLYYFFSPTCPHCTNFTPVWNELRKRVSNIPGLTTVAIDSSKPENENLSFYYNVSSFPTIILVTPDKNIEYPANRPRTIDNLQNFIMAYINNYQ